MLVRCSPVGWARLCPNDSPTRGIARQVVPEVVHTAVSYIACGAVPDITPPSPLSVISQGIRSGVRRTTAGATCRFIRPAVPQITRHATETATSTVVSETTRIVVPHAATGVLSFIVSRVPCPSAASTGPSPATRTSRCEGMRFGPRRARRSEISLGRRSQGGPHHRQSRPMNARALPTEAAATRNVRTSGSATNRNRLFSPTSIALAAAVTHMMLSQRNSRDNR